MKNYIRLLGEKINKSNNKVLENIYYFLCAIYYKE